jgi:precorrin-6A/cobalt-precorrin-6A reductase
MRILILGGTTEASAIARALAGDARFAPGRTRAPVAPPIPWRVGGFGGVDGLVAYLRAEGVAALIDATHPFAARMKANAARAAALAGIPRVAVLRPPWQPQPGDCWTEVIDMGAAFAALGAAPRRVFLAIGRQELAAARGLGLPVVMVVRPAPPTAPVVADAAGALDWLAHQAGWPCWRGV